MKDLESQALAKLNAPPPVTGPNLEIQALHALDASNAREDLRQQQAAAKVRQDAIDAAHKEMDRAWQAKVDDLTQQVQQAESDALDAEHIAAQYDETQKAGDTTAQNSTSTAGILFGSAISLFGSHTADKQRKAAKKARAHADALRAQLDAMGAQQPSVTTTCSECDAYITRAQTSNPIQNAANQGVANMNTAVAQHNAQVAEQPQAAAKPSGYTFHPAQNPPAPATTTAANKGTGTVGPIACVDLGPGNCMPIDQWNALQAQKNAPVKTTTYTNICPASGYYMRQVESDFAEREQCIPGQPITPNGVSGSSGGGVSSTSSPGGGSNTASGSNGAPGSAASGGNLVNPISSSCISMDFNGDGYNWDRYADNCGVNVSLDVIFPGGYKYSMDLRPDKTDGTGHGRQFYQDVGQPSLYVCPENYYSVDMNGNTFANPVPRYLCKK